MNNLTHEYVKELFDYCEESGKLTWKARRQRIRIGQEAGSINKGYRHTMVDGKRYFVHRIIWLWMTGEWPAVQIDHINGIKDDNRWCNLREATCSQNLRNKGKYQNNTSGYKNIVKVDRKSYRNGKAYISTCWRVQINLNKVKYGKDFPYTDDGLQQAIAWRDMMLPILHGEFNRFD